MMHGGGGIGALALLWALIGVALLVLIILVIIWMVRQLWPGHTRGQHDAAEEELRQRFAAGAIDRDEYLQRRSDLREK